jgi:hypothetical protein
VKSIEDHIRLKDPERYKAKLLELLHDKEVEITQQQELEDFSAIPAWGISITN